VAHPGTETVPDGHRRLEHVPALDGLRGLALLGVLFFHANGMLPGGYLGVDLFFVLSGYLITSLLVAERASTGHIALTAFWIRRARRLFPALLSLMPAIALYCRYVAKPGELAGLRSEALATLGYVANWRAIFAHKSYWELFTSPSPLEHTWSLAIEEQFYVVWPLVVMAATWKATGQGARRAVLGVSLVLGACSVAAMLLLFDPDPSKLSRVYLGTDTRAASILAGAAFATLLPPGTALAARTVRALDVLGALAALGLGVAWCTLRGDEPFLYRGGFWLTELAGLALIACAVAGRASLVGRVLSLRPLTLVGTISYGLYLWHWPVDVVLTKERLHLHGVALVLAQLVVTFAIATVSYQVLERPIRRHGVPFGRPVVIVPAAVALAVLLVVRATYARPTAAPAMPMLPPPPGAGSTEPVRFQIMLLGDSTANSLGWGLRGVQRPGVAVELRGQDGCTMLADMCGGERWSADVAELHPDATLVYLGGAFLHGLTIDNRWRKACHPGWDAKFEKYLTQRLGELQAAHGKGHGKVWAVTIPYPLGPYDSADFRAEVDCINASTRKAAAAVDGVKVLELGEQFCPKGVCIREHAGYEIRPDGVHYRIEGVAALATWALDELQR
jgi:peptidoglycan/LPS O-acetylase OafA/YrhL